LERELQLAYREVEAIRRTLSGTASSIPQSKLSVKSLGELIDDFNGSENTFENWKRQVELVIATYEIDNNAAKILISTKLKGKALRWFHSKPEYITMDLNLLLTEMKTMFDQ